RYGKNDTADEDRADKLCNTTLDSSNETISRLQKCFSKLNGSDLANSDSGSRFFGLRLDGVIFPLAAASVVAKISPNYRVMLGDTMDEYAF
ncbi:hypothetical protein PMAYCL1PPCAC_11173, partial [Pristionchus mayeri]